MLERISRDYVVKMGLIYLPKPSQIQYYLYFPLRTEKLAEESVLQAEKRPVTSALFVFSRRKFAANLDEIVGKMHRSTDP